jgi:hypothetical protein
LVFSVEIELLIVIIILFKERPLFDLILRDKDNNFNCKATVKSLDHKVDGLPNYNLYMRDTVG